MGSYGDRRKAEGVTELGHQAQRCMLWHGDLGGALHPVVCRELPVEGRTPPWRVVLNPRSPSGRQGPCRAETAPSPRPTPSGCDWLPPRAHHLQLGGALLLGFRGGRTERQLTSSAAGSAAPSSATSRCSSSDMLAAFCVLWCKKQASGIGLVLARARHERASLKTRRCCKLCDKLGAW